MLAGRIGGKTVITSALCITVVITLVSPALVTAGGAYALIATRILIGCFHGGMFPAVSTILSAWIPACERGLLASIVFCGLPVTSEMFFRVLVDVIYICDLIFSSGQSLEISFLDYY